MFPKLLAIVEAPTDNPIELARIAGCDVQQFFRGASFGGVDVRGLDLRSMDFTGADFSGIIGDEFTRVDDEFLNEIQFHSLATMANSIDGVLNDETYMDYYEILGSIRALSEISNIGVSGSIERYFQNGAPLVSGFKFSELGSWDPKSKRFLNQLKHMRRNFEIDFSNLEITHVEFDVTAPENFSPCNTCIISGVSLPAEPGFQIHFDGLDLTIGRNKQYTEEVPIEIEFESLAVPKAILSFEIVLETTGVVRVEREGQSK